MTFATHEADQSSDGLLTGLRYALGNTCRLARATALFSWNLVGPGALAAADELTAQAEELRAASPQIALTIRNAGFVASPDYIDAIIALPIEHLAATVRPGGAAEALREGHVQARLSLETTLDVAADYGDHASLALLTRRLEAHQRHIYRLSLI